MDHLAAVGRRLHEIDRLVLGSIADHVDQNLVDEVRLCIGVVLVLVFRSKDFVALAPSVRRVRETARVNSVLGFLRGKGL